METFISVFEKCHIHFKILSVLISLDEILNHVSTILRDGWCIIKFIFFERILRRIRIRILKLGLRLSQVILLGITDWLSGSPSTWISYSPSHRSDWDTRINVIPIWKTSKNLHQALTIEFEIFIWVQLILVEETSKPSCIVKVQFHCDSISNTTSSKSEFSTVVYKSTRWCTRLDWNNFNSSLLNKALYWCNSHS